MDKKENRKNEIIRDSINVMYLKGYNSTSVNDIAVAAGIPKGSFYNYFKDKEHYAVDAIAFYQNFLVEDKIALLSKKDLAPLERIKAFFDTGINQLVTNEYKFGCFAGNLAQEMGDVSDAISRVLEVFYDNMVNLIHKNLLLAKESGDLAIEVDLQSLASFLISSWQGVQLRAKVARDSNSLEEFSVILNNVLLK